MYLAALQPVLVLGLQLVQSGPETLLLLRRHGGVRPVQEGAGGLGDLKQPGLLGLELLELHLGERERGREVRLCDAVNVRRVLR